jgi:hypothetical protein
MACGEKRPYSRNSKIFQVMAQNQKGFAVFILSGATIRKILNFVNE